jgi:hypothetical protein
MLSCSHEIYLRKSPKQQNAISFQRDKTKKKTHKILYLEATRYNSEKNPEKKGFLVVTTFGSGKTRKTKC